MRFFHPPPEHQSNTAGPFPGWHAERTRPSLESCRSRICEDSPASLLLPRRVQPGGLRPWKRNCRQRRKTAALLPLWSSGESLGLSLHPWVLGKTPPPPGWEVDGATELPNPKAWDLKVRSLTSHHHHPQAAGTETHKLHQPRPCIFGQGSLGLNACSSGSHSDMEGLNIPQAWNSSLGPAGIRWDIRAFVPILGILLVKTKPL